MNKVAIFSDLYIMRMEVEHWEEMVAGWEGKVELTEYQQLALGNLCVVLQDVRERFNTAIEDMSK